MSFLVDPPWLAVNGYLIAVEPLFSWTEHPSLVIGNASR